MDRCRAFSHLEVEHAEFAFDLAVLEPAAVPPRHPLLPLFLLPARTGTLPVSDVRHDLRRRQCASGAGGAGTPCVRVFAEVLRR